MSNTHSSPFLPWAVQVVGENLTLTRCGGEPAGFENPVTEALAWTALHGNRIRVRGLTATENGGPAVMARAARIQNGTLADNAGDLGGYDLLTGTRPRLEDTTCTSSGRVVSSPSLEIDGSWLVRSGD